jgi:proton-dependent oligopeptide transporter, POT family
MNQVADTEAAARAEGPLILGQPRGLATLFLTEMWERFSFYGNRAMLVLFMTAAVTRGGLGIADKTANSA